MPTSSSDPLEHARDSTSEWLGRLKTGEAAAVQNLWERYSQELILLANQRLGTASRRLADEEDVALSVFGSICRGAAAGRFEQVKSRDELWWLLLSITKRKAVDHIRRETAEKRGGGREQQELRHCADKPGVGEFSLDDLISPTPTPELIVTLDEQYARLLSLLRDDRLRQIAVMRIEGYTDEEIAQRMLIGVRAVERKLQLIRANGRKNCSSRIRVMMHDVPSEERSNADDRIDELCDAFETDWRKESGRQSSTC